MQQVLLVEFKDLGAAVSLCVFPFCVPFCSLSLHMLGSSSEVPNRPLGTLDAAHFLSALSEVHSAFSWGSTLP